MTYFTMLIGPSGSGKSSYAEVLKNMIQNSIIISSDEIRAELWGDAADQQNGAKVFQIMNERTFNALKNGQSVIYDATNLWANTRTEMVKNIKALGIGCRCIAVVIRTPIDQCKERQFLRDRKVPNEVIERQFNNFQEPTYREGWDNIMYH